MKTDGDKTIAVIGAGPAGLTAAYMLAKAGVRVEVFEADGVVGGMAKTIELWGQLIDLGPHRFYSNDPRVNQIWLEVVGENYDMVDRLTRIYYKNTFFDYPLTISNARKGLGIVEAFHCVASYVTATIAPAIDELTFENWVVNRFGRRLFEIFFKSYSEKLWGISCQELDAEFAAQRIRKLSLFEAVKSAILKHSVTKHKTLADQFAYAFNGTGSAYESMATRITALGGTIHLNTPVKAIVPCQNGDGATLETFSGQRMAFNHVISSMPITDLVVNMGAPDTIRECASMLQFRNTILVFLEINGSSPFPDQWIYIHSPDLKTGRITNFSNWLPSIKRSASNTILCLEFWCSDQDDLWHMDEQSLVSLGTREAYSTTLLLKGSVLNGKVVKLPKCYPVYSRGYRKVLEPIEKYLAGFASLSLIGRYGSFKYNNQDHSILMGLLAAENIIGDAKHDLWQINTDYDYQESSIITKTGLHKC